jgi:hypothetical protein
MANAKEKPLCDANSQSILLPLNRATPVQMPPVIESVARIPESRKPPVIAALRSQ